MTPPDLSAQKVDDLLEMWTTQLHEANTTLASSAQPFLDIFARGGAAALRASLANEAWVQVSVSRPLDSDSHADLLGSVSELVNELFGNELIENFFFMNKPPGLRLRFEAAGPSFELKRRIQTHATRWKADGLIDNVKHGIYEPESQLFGGAESMRYVHSLFSLDSLVWLAFHATTSSGERSSHTHPWQVSFACSRALFEGLGIVGWEDLGVWNHIVEETGRKTPDAVAALPDYLSLQADVIELWDASTIPTKARTGIAAARQSSFREAGERWRSGYFDQPGAWIGPRQAAAYVTIFSWNRAMLSANEQALIAGTLANRQPCKPTGEGTNGFASS